MKKFALITLLFILPMSSFANIIAVNFEVRFQEPFDKGNGFIDDFWASGAFSGQDLNNDNKISFQELVSFELFDNYHLYDLEITPLTSFSDFIISNNVWTLKPIQIRDGDLGWFTLGTFVSVDSDWAFVETSLVNASASSTFSMFFIMLLIIGFKKWFFVNKPLAQI